MSDILDRSWRTEAVCGLLRGWAEGGGLDWYALPVLADALEDVGAYLLAAQVRQGPPPLGLSFFDGYGDGSGYGYGYGYGDGYGDGSGYGYGYGYGYSNGYGNGDGSLIYGTLTLGGRVMPEVGKNQLIVLPHGWVICGFVAEQTGPYQFRVERATVIARTGGVPWDQLASGKGDRTAPMYRMWGDVLIGPQFVMSTEWVGELPRIA